MQQLIFGLFGGTAILLLGIEMLGEGLEKAVGQAMRRILNTLTSSLWRGIGLGTLVTAIIQSSSATTVMVVGFVNAGMMTLEQGLGVIYGANIGTTMTSQLLRLKITDYALPIIGVGVLLKMFARRDRWRNIGVSIIGFGLLFLGLTTLGSGSEYLSQNPAISNFMQTYASNPFVSILIGLAITGIIQSSSASTGLVVALAQVGLLDIRMATGITLGNNIGTCVTAMLASSGTSKAARRTAWGHMLFNIAGVLMVLPFFNFFVDFVVGTSSDIKGQIANMHTIFNIATTVVFIPFTSRFAKLLYRIVPGEVEEIEIGARHLDKLLLDTPDAAVQATFLELERTNQVATRMYRTIYKANGDNDVQSLKLVRNDEDLLNRLQREVTRYMVDLGQRELSADQSALIPDLLHIIGDLERVGDHAFAMIELLEKKVDQNLHFSDTASRQLTEIVGIIDQLSELVDQALKGQADSYIEPTRALEAQLKRLTEQARDGHIERLEKNLCTVEAGVYFLDILSHFERIGEHFRTSVLSCAHRRSELSH